MSITQTFLTKAILIEVPEQHTQFYRPMEGYLGPNAINQVLSCTEGGININPGTLANVANGIISPNTVPVAQVEMVNGFQMKRFSFCFEFTTVGGNAGHIIEIVRGYTDLSTDAVSLDGRHIDPNVVFYVNDYITFVKNNTLSFRRNDGVLNPLVYQSNGVALTPDATISHSSLDKFRSEGVYSGIVNPSTVLFGRPHLYESQDNSSSNYLSKVLNGYKKASSPYIGGMDIEETDQSLDMYQTAIGLTKAQTLSTNFWANKLLNGVYDTASFSYRTMMHHFSDFGFDKWQLVKKRPGTYVRNPLMETDGWNNASMECYIVYCLTHLLPDLLSKSLIQKINIYCSNENLGNRRQVNLNAPVSLFESALTDLRTITQLQQLIEVIILQGFVETRCSTYSISMELDLLETSFFNISINGYPAQPFCAPMYCASASSPMIGLSAENLDNITATVYRLAQNVTEAFSLYSVKPSSIMTMGHDFVQSKIASDTLDSFMKAPSMTECMIDLRGITI
jgi:hypothetical protein